MPELPDVTLYVERLAALTQGATLDRLRIVGPFLLRSVDPPITDAEGKKVLGVRRLGKRIVMALESDLFLVLHLMIAGRLEWRARGATPAKVPAKVGLAVFEFSTGVLVLTEASPQKRASLHLVRGEDTLASHHAGGIEPLEATPDQFRAALVRENHTLKRSLTDPRLFSGIGNAYSDEILHAAGLSPVKLTHRLPESEVARLYDATRETLTRWTEALRRDVGERFPTRSDVTAFRPGFAAHGKYGQPCPVCGTAIQRIIYAENETNYCPRCQTGGKVLADRSLSRLLKSDWPRTVEELEGRGS